MLIDQTKTVNNYNSSDTYIMSSKTQTKIPFIKKKECKEKDKGKSSKRVSTRLKHQASLTVEDSTDVAYQLILTTLNNYLRNVTAHLRLE